MTDLRRLDELVDGFYPQMEADLCALVRYPSIQSAPLPGKPYGQVVADCLDAALARAAELGFVTHNQDYEFGLVDWLADQLPPEQQIGVLSHVDVVPVVEADWHSAPFECRIADGRIYGRGTIDDKGPLLSALYATLALKQFCAEHGLTPKKGVRHIIGCNEENGMTCMEHFVKTFPQPSCSFSPDGGFPGVIGEKGLVHWEMKRDFGNAPQHGALELLSVDGGTAGNIVPGAAMAELKASEDALQVAEETLAQLPAADQAHLRLTRTVDGFRVEANGTAAHGSLPEQGYNAISVLLRYLCALPLAVSEQADFCQKAGRLLASSYDGAGLGMKAADAVSELTAVHSILRVDAQGGMLHIDLRYPVTHQESTYKKQAEQVAAETGWQISLWDCHGPMYVPEDATPAKELIGIYREVTGDDAPPQIVGSATYARVLDHAIAFGPEFADEPYTAHQADENISIEKWRLAARIYARALYQLCLE